MGAHSGEELMRRSRVSIDRRAHVIRGTSTVFFLTAPNTKTNKQDINCRSARLPPKDVRHRTRRIAAAMSNKLQLTWRKPSADLGSPRDGSRLESVLVCKTVTDILVVEEVTEKG